MPLTVDTAEIREASISKILTQYRESPALLATIDHFLQLLEEVMIQINSIPDYFDLESAVGEQLTFIGSRMGFVRTHCVCTSRLVYGIAGGPCEDEPFIEIAGLCAEAADFIDCDAENVGTITIHDDELYRNCLRVCAFRIGNQYTWNDLTTCIRILFGEQAIIAESGNGRVVLWPGRELTGQEHALLQVYARILPVAMGIKIFFHLGILPIAGIGEGWGGLCETIYDGANIVDELGNNEVDENGDNLVSSLVIWDAELLCEYDPRPYDCSIP